MSSCHCYLLPFDKTMVLHREMEWVLEANVRYVKCLGGPRGCEGIMVACRDGQVLKVYVNNAFPCHVWQHPRPIRYADISVGSSGLAVIDDDAKLTVINLLSGMVRTFTLHALQLCCDKFEAAVSLPSIHILTHPMTCTRVYSLAQPLFRETANCRFAMKKPMLQVLPSIKTMKRLLHTLASRC